MRADVLSVLLTCASVGAVVVFEGEDTLSKGRYCDLTGGGFGACKEKENCSAGDTAQTEKCSSPLVCCPLPGAKAIQMCDEYSRIESRGSCPEGNSPTAQFNEFPHMAALGYNNIRNNEWLCGGTLISNRFVLTAGNCARSARVGPPRRVRLGDIEIADREVSNVQQVSVEEVIVHPDYRPPKKSNDIALLKLSKDVKLSSFVRPACLHTTTELTATTGFAMGWGTTSYDSQRAGELQKVRLPFVMNEVCQEAYKDRLRADVFNTSSMLCAGDKGRDTCSGDSGGPLQVTKSGPNCMASIVGLTSFGTLCGTVIPSVYTRVSHYVPWIESVVWP